MSDAPPFVETDMLLQKAVIAYQAKRYEDVTIFMKAVIKQEGTLHGFGIHLFSMSFRMLKDSKQIALAKLSTILCKVKGPMFGTAMRYLWEIKNELFALCQDVICLLDEFLLPNAPNIEAKVLYLRTKGDYLRYIIAVNNAQTQHELINEAYWAYEEAYSTALSVLEPRNITRIGVALNYAVFYYETMHYRYSALFITKEAIADITTAECISPSNDLLLLKGLYKLQYNMKYWLTGEH